MLIKLFCLIFEYNSFLSKNYDYTLSKTYGFKSSSFDHDFGPQKNLAEAPHVWEIPRRNLAYVLIYFDFLVYKYLV